MKDVINLKRVSKEYPGAKALDRISFSVSKGSIHGFLGPNGAGKTTAMNIITGLIPPSEGEAFINGQNVQKNLKQIQSKIGFLPENPPLYHNMIVEDYLKFVAKINGISGNDLKKKIGLVVEKCGLEKCSKRMIGNLSKGYKQRVGIAQSMVFDPEIIILDEPWVGLDPEAITEIRNLIISLKENRTVLLSTHQLHEANRICSDITIINKGRMIQSGPISKLHESFRNHQIIWAEVLNWDDSILIEVKKEFRFNSIEVIQNDRSFGIKFISTGKDDIRVGLSNLLVSKSCGLIFFQEEKLDLEDIFKVAVKE